MNGRGLDNTQIVIAAAVIAIIGGAAGFLLGRSTERGPTLFWAPEEESGMEALPPGSALGTITLGGNAVAVNDQAPGLRVAVAMVTLARDGWVVIHEDRDGKPGNILGAQRFGSGANQSGSVDLLRSTEEGRVYYAMLHSDDGDRAFDHAKDLPLTDPQGNVILMRFVAAAAPQE